jgi:transmembrane sensor
MTDGLSDRIDREAVEWLARLRAGDPADQAAFEQWYATDTAHADAYDRVLRTWETAGRLDKTSLGQARARDAEHPSRSRFVAIAAVAGILAALLVSVGVMLGAPGLPSATAAFAFETKPGQIRSVKLDDGSSVTLDTDSALKGEFSSSRRHVQLLRGRARFDVTDDVHRPFVVETSNGSVTAAGSIDVTVDRSRMTIALWRGKADISDSLGHPVPIALADGQALGVDAASPNAAVAARPAADSRWVKGMLSFEDAPVSEVVAEANRYANVPITLADASIGDERFTGTFTATDTRSLAQMLAAMFDLTITTDRGGGIILSRHKR